MMRKNPDKESFYRIRNDVLVCLFLVIATLVVYWQVRNHAFVNFDDTVYVSENQNVQSGLNLDGIHWAFSSRHKSDRLHWHPLTWLSHMLDWQLYGSNSGMHHLTSLILHIANSVLLFLVFRRITGAVWKSAFVAALFALHPINVDSVAWVAQRKNVLSAFFWMLTMLTYTNYTERPGLLRYMLVFLVFALGLMAKPMLVTLPFVFLLLDYWPLGRLRYGQLGGKGSDAFRLFLEKVPFFALSAISICVSSLSQKGYGVVIPTESVPMKLRVANALVSYVSYIGKMIWPQDLAFFYPYPSSLPLWQVLGSGLLLIGISVLIIWALKAIPYLGVGWLWYLGTLVPVSGLMQVGLWPAMADRWAYVPLIGLFIIIAWGVPELVARWRYRKVGLAIAAGVLSILMATTRAQVRHWTNSIALCEHALAVTSNNSVAHYNLGVALSDQNRTAEAIYHYSEVLRISPSYVDAYNNLGNALKKEGRTAEALSHYTEALQINPDYEKAHNNLGNVLEKLGETADAISHYSEALRINPGYVDAHNNLANALAKQGKTSEAINHYSEALRINPDSFVAYINLGNTLVAQGRLDEAIDRYAKALGINPACAEAHNYIGVALVRKGMIEEAVGRFREALRIKPDYASARDNLEKILAAKKKFDSD